ncbi:MAG: hypothetical protein KAG93_06320 [Desulfuromusa sp.]|nr:hypothetical protein [Desulfuromusa sp.]
MFKHALLVTIFSLLATIAAAGSVNIGLSNKSFQLGYEQPINQDDYGTVMANGRILHNDDKDSTLGSLGLDFVGDPGNVSGLTLGVGSKFYLGSASSGTDFTNLAVGLRSSYILPQLQGLGVSGHLYYAPEIFSFQDSEHLLESGVRLTYAILPKATLYIGYQNIDLGIKHRSNSRTVDDSVRIGFIGSF